MPRQKETPLEPRLADGSESPIILHEIDLTLLVGPGFAPYKATFQVMKVGIAPIILGAPFCRTARPQFDWEARTIRSSDSDAPGAAINAIEAPSPNTIPTDYKDFEDVFSEAEADVLPPRRPFDHTIPLIEGATPTFGPIYRLSVKEQEALDKYLASMLKKGFIRVSSSPASSPLLFVEKNDGSLRPCIDYRKLNAITIKNRYPLPLISELLDALSKAGFYTKIDLRGAYNLLRIALGEEWKTAFRTNRGLFEYLVMPFGLTNAPASFQHLMNHIFGDMIGVCVIVYLDDILVYSLRLSEHIEHVREVLKRLRNNHLYAKLEKCEFHTRRVEFLGYVVSNEGIEMDKAKVEAVIGWPEPTTVREVQSFLGFANFYRRFIKNFSAIQRPLSALTRKGIEFVFGPKEQAAFTKVKNAISSAPVLRHFDPTLRIIIETDASDFALGAVLSQEDSEGVIRPVAFLSRRMEPAELNYPVHDKEFLAIVWACKEWSHYLEGSPAVEIITDHRSLEYFLISKLLTRREARMVETMSRFDSVISIPTRKEVDKARRSVETVRSQTGGLPRNYALDRSKQPQHAFASSP